MLRRQGRTGSGAKFTKHGLTNLYGFCATPPNPRGVLARSTVRDGLPMLGLYIPAKECTMIRNRFAVFAAALTLLTFLGGRTFENIVSQNLFSGSSVYAGVGISGLGISLTEGFVSYSGSAFDGVVICPSGGGRLPCGQWDGRPSQCLRPASVGRRALPCGYAMAARGHLGRHDMMPVADSPLLVLATAAHTWLFDRTTHHFTKHPVLGDVGKVKSVHIDPASRRLLWVQRDGTTWWSDVLHLRDPDTSITLPGEKIYKVRWMPTGASPVPGGSPRRFAGAARGTRRSSP